jgi:hypothetical protein
MYFVGQLIKNKHFVALVEFIGLGQRQKDFAIKVGDKGWR